MFHYRTSFSKKAVFLLRKNPSTMQPRCGSEIKISSPRHYLMQVLSHRQHGQHCHCPVLGECELHRLFAQKKIFSLPVESRPIHFHCHVMDMCESVFKGYNFLYSAVDREWVLVVNTAPAPFYR